MIKTILNVLAEVADEVLGMVKRGASDEEILKHISDPSGVGQKLIDAARRRRSQIETFVKDG